MPTTPRKTNVTPAKPAPTIDHATAILVIMSKAVSPAKRVAPETPDSPKPGKSRPRRSRPNTDP
jgi:hypothetical protein